MTVELITLSVHFVNNQILRLPLRLVPLTLTKKAKATISFQPKKIGIDSENPPPVLYTYDILSSWFYCIWNFNLAVYDGVVIPYLYILIFQYKYLYYYQMLTTHKHTTKTTTNQSTMLGLPLKFFINFLNVIRGVDLPSN